MDDRVTLDGIYRKAVKEDFDSKTGHFETVLDVWPAKENPPMSLFSIEPPITFKEASEEEYKCFKGDPPLITQWLNCDKSAMYETAEDEGLTDEQAKKLITALLEVKFVVDVTTGTIVAVNDKILATAQDYKEPE